MKTLKEFLKDKRVIKYWIYSGAICGALFMMAYLTEEVYKPEMTELYHLIFG